MNELAEAEAAQDMTEENAELCLGAKARTQYIPSASGKLVDSALVHPRPVTAVSVYASMRGGSQELVGLTAVADDDEPVAAAHSVSIPQMSSTI